MAAARTPLTYYGGKQGLARQIVPLMPRHRVYLEPFAGGAAMLFAKPRCERETLNDLDGQIMRFWRALRDYPDELAAAVAATPYGREEWRASRDGEGGMSDVEAARRLLPRWDRADALIYVDPPYTGVLRTEPAKGYAVDDDDGTLWTRLVAALAEVQHAAVILSGYPCEEAEALGWRMVPLRMKRTVQSRDGGTLADAPEVVWLSPAVPEVVPNLLSGVA
jgi:site-specific DNA-adenine methylase